MMRAGLRRRVGGPAVVVAGMLLCGCGAEAAETSATVVWYLEQEAGGPPTRVRYIVTGVFLRSDEGRDEGGFLLLDRRRRQISSVVPETGSVLHIDGTGPPPKAPAALSIDVQQSQDPQAPSLEGRQPLTLVLRAGDTVCQSAIVVPDLLEDVSSAFREFYQALAAQQARTLDSTPEEFQTPCYLARYLYAGDFHFAAGLPVVEWSGAGERRELVEYQQGVPVDDALFVIPEALRSYQIQAPAANRE